MGLTVKGLPGTRLISRARVWARWLLKRPAVAIRVIRTDPVPPPRALAKDVKIAGHRVRPARRTDSTTVLHFRVCRPPACPVAVPPHRCPA